MERVGALPTVAEWCGRRNGTEVRHSFALETKIIRTGRCVTARERTLGFLAAVAPPIREHHENSHTPSTDAGGSRWPQLWCEGFAAAWTAPMATFDRPQPRSSGQGQTCGGSQCL